MPAGEPVGVIDLRIVARVMNCHEVLRSGAGRPGRAVPETRAHDLLDASIMDIDTGSQAHRALIL